MAITQELALNQSNGETVLIKVKDIASMTCNLETFFIELNDGRRLCLKQSSYLECLPLYSGMLKGKCML